MAFDLSKSWLGVGEKTGGMLVVGGAEYTSGLVVRGSNLENPFGFSITSARVGLGLGFSGGLVGMIIFNCENLQRLNNTEVSDWGVSFSLGGRWSSIVAAMRRSEYFIQLARIGWRIRGVASHGESVRNFLHYAYTANDIRALSNQPTIITFDIPIGGGVEVAANFSVGRIRFS